MGQVKFRLVARDEFGDPDCAAVFNEHDPINANA